MNTLKKDRIIKDFIFIVVAAVLVAALKNNGDGASVFIVDFFGTVFLTTLIMYIIRSICRETIKEEISLAIEEHLKNRSTEDSNK